jgi:hypothetical protein
MAVIHQTTMVPSKLELLTSWLPRQDWYAGEAGGPSLAKVGGFRLDDPAGEVGIELMVVRDDAANGRAYLVPMTYRGSPLQGRDAGLIGTSQHGVLGARWIYDGTRDPVLLEQLMDLVQGRSRRRPRARAILPTRLSTSRTPRRRQESSSTSRSLGCCARRQTERLRQGSARSPACGPRPTAHWFAACS